MRKLFYTLLMISAALFAEGQTKLDFIEEAQKQLQTPVNGVIGGPEGKGVGVVGAIGGSVDVSGLGAATYTIPIDVPQGIGGIQPNLSINYNSQSGNGLLGWGWNLAGVSSITRTGADFYHDGFIKGVDFGHVTGNGSGLFPFGPNTQRVFDRFSLDGQRLILVEGSYYGQNNSQYKTEVDGMSKIVAYTESGIRGAAKFKVWTADGLIMEYGFNNNARMIRTCPDNSNLKEVGAWLLNRVEDRNGNFMLYQYDVSGDQYSLTKIYYSGNTNAKTDERGSACYSVNFIYQDRIDSDITFIGNHALKQNKLLTSIEIRWWDQLVSQYDFGYHEINPDLGYFFHRLKDVTYSNDGVAYNPTTITWRTNDYGSPQIYGMDGLNDSIKTSDKFTGDFNGDGMSDFIAIKKKVTGQNFWGNDIYKYVGYVYYNNGLVEVNGLNKVRFSYQYQIDFGDTEPNIYAADFNGDGRDDMVTVARKSKSNNIDYFVIQPYINCYENSSQSWKLYASYRDWADFDISISHELPSCPMMIGDFLGRGKNEMVMQIPEGNSSHAGNKLLYITYLGDCTFHMENTHQQGGGVLPGRQQYAADFDGDGLLEVYCKDFFGNASTHIYKFTSECSVQQIDVDNPLTNKDYVNIGDYNGDGKADVLSINSETNNSETNEWKLYLFKQNRFYEAYDVDSNLPTSFSYDNFSIQDFNGDGKADVLFRNPQGGVDVFYTPIIIDDNTSVVRFTSTQHYNIDIGFSSLVVGNFLGQENPSILRKNYIFSLKPISNRYNVKCITDGMGNNVEFEYDYLTTYGSSIYSWSKDFDKPELDIYSTPIPIKAVKKVKTSNPLAASPTTSTCYYYSNALVHRKGRGMLGFLKTTTVSYINGVKQDSIVTSYSTEPIKTHRTLSLTQRCVYNNLKNLVLKEIYTNNYIENNSNSLVYIPVVTKLQTLAYNPDTGESELLSKSVTDNTYKVDEASNGSNGLGRYHHTLKLTDVYEGMTNNQLTSNAIDCPYVTHTQTFYQPDWYVNNWIINRPDSTVVTAWKNGDPYISKSLITYSYRDNTSYQTRKIKSYPGGDRNNANGLATSTAYEYDIAGNIMKETLAALSGTPSARITDYTYWDFRLPKTETNAMGYVSQTHFDVKYCELHSSTDRNGQVTYYNRSDHLGSSEWVRYPDVTYGCTAKRWARNENGFYDPDSPVMAAYYTWKRISGETPVKTFFDAVGRELRTVSYGLHGDTIYQDTEYNNFGLVYRKSLPYFKNDTKQWTSYYYDGLLRLQDTYYPDGTHISVRFDGLTTTSSFYTTDGRMRTSSETTNYLGQKTKTVDALGTEVNYVYYPNGKLKYTQVGTNSNTRIRLEYDDAGNRTMIHDPNYGVVNETYDAFGQLRTSLSPKHDLTRYDYDIIGRCINRIEIDENHQTTVETGWTYSETTGQKGLLQQIRYGDNQTITYNYDAMHLNRLSSKTERLFGTDYHTSYTYDDDFGFPLRVQSVTYPTGYETHNIYDPVTSQLYKIEDGQGNDLWETLEKNAIGQITRFTTGNGIQSERLYYPTTGRLQGIYSMKNNNVLQNLGYNYDDFGNLAARYDNTRNLTESFGYDELDRLDTIRLNGVITGRMVYDALGRMTDKWADGQAVFSSAQHDYLSSDGQIRPHAISSAQTGNGFTQQGIQSIDYTMFDKTKSMSFGNKKHLFYDYGYNHQRIMMYETDLSVTYMKHYVGNCEFVSQQGIQQELTYLSGPLGVFAVVEKRNDIEYVHYVLKDHLGSWTTITNSAGQVEQEVSFDAWGNPRDPNTWSSSYSNTLMFDRGFTGHEHLCFYTNNVDTPWFDIGLINMNGRMYDPVMSTFLSVDNYVQEPDFSQNFNRYAYCLNNPLKYTDPSGEVFGIDDVLVAMAVSAVLNVTINGINNVKYGENFFLGAGKAAVVGAVQGLFSYGIGECAGAMDILFKSATVAKFAKAGFQLVAHGTVGGISTESRGGNFWHGFVSSAVASLVSTSTNMLTAELPKAWQVTCMVTAGGLSGGLTASMVGGDFWDGVCNGLISAGLNHAMHLVIEGGELIFKLHRILNVPKQYGPMDCKYAVMEAVAQLYGETTTQAYFKYIGQMLIKNNPSITLTELFRLCGFDVNKYSNVESEKVLSMFVDMDQSGIPIGVRYEPNEISDHMGLMEGVGKTSNGTIFYQLSDPKFGAHHVFYPQDSPTTYYQFYGYQSISNRLIEPIKSLHYY
jgi:RHS repeat-associated protein